MIDKTKLDEKTTKMLLREIKVMDACNHPNLVRLYEVLENKGKLANIKPHTNTRSIWSILVNYACFQIHLSLSIQRIEIYKFRKDQAILYHAVWRGG